MEKSPLERFDSLSEAMEKFLEYKGNDMEDKGDKVRATLGFNVDGIEFDVIHVRNKENCLSLDFTHSKAAQESRQFMEDLQVLSDKIGFDKVRVHREMTPEEVKDFVKQRFEYQLKQGGFEDISFYMSRFDNVYEQGKMDNLLPATNQKHIVEDIPFTEWENPYIDVIEKSLLRSLLRNPYGEEKFKIEKSMSGSYMVRSDSKKFGEQAVVYENRDRNECVNYIDRRQPAGKPEYYVIENLHDFMKGKNENIIWGTLKECLEKYSEYARISYLRKEEYKDHVICTFGVTTGKNDMDLVHCINGKSYAGTEIIKNQEHNVNKYILDDTKTIIDILDIREAAKIRENSIDYIPLEQLDGKEIYAGYSKKTMLDKGKKSPEVQISKTADKSASNRRRRDQKQKNTQKSLQKTAKKAKSR